MAGSLSDYAENKILDSVFRAVNFSPANLYLALFTQGSGLEANDLNAVSEVITTDSGYARIKVNDQGGYTASVGGMTTNAQNLEFATALADWGTITHTALMDAPTDGNVIIWGEITNPRDIFAGDAVRVRAGANVITLD